MKTNILVRTAILAVALFVAIPAFATLNGPSTDGDGNYTITWPTVCGNDSWYYLHENGQQIAAKYCTSGSFAVSGRSNGTYNYVLNHCNTFWPEPGLICDFDLGSNSGTHTVVVTGSEPPPPPPTFDSRAFGPCRIALDNPPPDPEYNYIEAWWENNLVCQTYLSLHNAYPAYDINGIQRNGLPVLIHTQLLEDTLNAYGLLVWTLQLEAMNAGGFMDVVTSSGSNLATAAGLILSSPVINTNDNWWFSFSRDAHDQILQEALGDYNLPPGLIFVFQTVSREFDEHTGVQPWGSQRHHMCDLLDSQTSCRNQVNEFIEAQMTAACAAANSGDEDAANTGAGQAMHAVTDGSSPVHVAENGEIMVWYLANGIFHGSSWFSEEDVDDLTPDILLETGKNVRYVYDSVYNNPQCESIQWPPPE